MASRADASGILGVAGATPSFGTALRATVRDLYEDSWRFVAVNALWSAAVVVCLALFVSAGAVGWLAVVALGLPTSLVFHLATLAVRGEPVLVRSAFERTRADVAPSLALAAASTGAALVLASDLIGGLATLTPVGVGLATLAFWGLVATWLFAWTAWPLLADPSRRQLPASHRLRLAALLLIARPGRVAGLGLLLLALIGVSAVTAVPLLTVSVSVAAVLAGHVVLPAADRLEPPPFTG